MCSYNGAQKIPLKNRTLEDYDLENNEYQRVLDSKEFIGPFYGFIGSCNVISEISDFLDYHCEKYNGKKLDFVDNF